MSETKSWPEMWRWPEVQEAVAIMTTAMHEEEEAWPRILSYAEDGGLRYHAIDPAFMADWRRKNLLSVLIIRECHLPRAKVSVLMSDAFGASLPPGEKRDTLPANLGDLPADQRTEFLLVCVNARGQEGFGVQIPYSRDAQGRRVFGLPDPPQPVLRSRFVFDLKNKSELAAVAEALVRDREGSSPRGAPDAEVDRQKPGPQKSGSDWLM